MISERQPLEHRRQRHEAPRDPGGLRRARAPPCRGSASAASCSSRSRRPRRAPPSRARGRSSRARSAARRDRCVAQIAASARNSWAKSRSLTASIELSNARREPESRRSRAGIQPERRRGERSRAERGHRGPDRPVVEALEVAGERPRVREQVMPERDGLREPRVRRARHHGLGVLACARDERPTSIARPSVDPPAPQRGATAAGR